MVQNKKPLNLPKDFDSKVNLPVRNVNGKVFHATIPGMNLVAELIENGTELDIERAERVMDAVFESQERRIGAPHYGNFTWEREDQIVEDLNAVHFTIMPLIRVLLDRSEFLPVSVKDKAFEGIRLGLEAIARIDVHVRYTTIVAADVFDSCLGGELLNDKVFMERGRDKLREWIDFTGESGTFYEYNCPGYTGMSIERLAELAKLSCNEPTRVIADVFAARMGVSALLHGHLATNRWSGPFSRAYQPQIDLSGPSEIGWMRSWIEYGTLPQWMLGALEDKPIPCEIKETSDSSIQQMMTTYLADEFSLGVASKDLSSQANRFIEGESSVFIAHFNCDADTDVLLSKYVVDEKWLGDFRTTPSRSNMQLQPDEGRFWGTQDRTRAIGLYTPRVIGARQPCKGLKMVLVWMRRHNVDEIWIGDRKVDKLPEVVERDQTIVVGSGSIYTAIHLLTFTELSYNPPIRLVERNGSLVLEAYNYEGPSKTFWELGWPGSFYQGLPQAGFYAEIAKRSDFSDGREFVKEVERGQFLDHADAPFTFSGNDDQDRTWKVEYSRDGRNLGIEIDLMRWKLKRRWTENGEQDWPMMESPLMEQNATGLVQMGEAVLRCGKFPAWVFANPKHKCWVAGYHGPGTAQIVFEVPHGKVEVDAMSTGMIVWEKGLVHVHGNDLSGAPSVSGGKLIN